MMKRILTLTAALLLAAGAMAQNVMPTEAKIGTVTAPAFTVTIQKSEKLVQEAMNKRLKEAGLKAKNDNGYVAAIDQLFAEIATVPINLYTKVEKESKNSTVVVVCVIPTNFSSDQTDMQANARRFLEGFAAYVDKHEASLNMAAEKDNLKKATKVHASAVSAVEKIDKSIQSDREKIASKQKEIEKYNQKIKECQEDIKKLEASIAKSQSKRADAEKDVNAAQENVKAVEGEVEKYRSLSE